MANFRFLYITLIITLLTVWGFSTIAAEAATPKETVVAYFKALKRGDTEEIKNLLAYNYYRKKSVLLDNNPNYSEFLKKYHHGMEFRILGLVQNSDRAYVEVEQILQDGTIKIVTMILNQAKSGDWKITEEIIKP